MEHKGPPSLVEVARKQCLRHVNVINDVGEAPFELVAPILKKMSSKQLCHIEELSPQIAAKSSVIWEGFIKRDFPQKAVPNGNFKKRYLEMHKEREQQRWNASEKLRMSFQKIKADKEARTITKLAHDPFPVNRRPSSLPLNRDYASSFSSSSIINKARQSARAKGAIFSRRNTRFVTPATTQVSQAIARTSKLPSVTPARPMPLPARAPMPSNMPQPRDSSAASPNASPRRTTASNLRKPALPSFLLTGKRKR